MVANDPHNRKQPLLLGMIALVSGILLALFILKKVKAEEIGILRENNYCQIIVSGYSFEFIPDTVIPSIDANSTEEQIESFKHNFLMAINDFFNYVPKDELTIFIYQNDASHRFLQILEGLLTDVGVTFFEDAGPDQSYTYILKYAPAGMYEIPYYSRSNPVQPSATPTPSPIPVVERSSLVFHAFSSQYFLIDFYGSNVGNTSVTVPSNSVLQSLQTEYNSIDDVTVNSALLMRSLGGNTNANLINLWFNADVLDEVKIYFLSSEPVDLDYVRENNTPYTFNIQTVGDGFYDSLNNTIQTFNASWNGYLAKDSTTLKRFCLLLRYYYNASNISWGVDTVTGSLATNFFSLQLDNDFSGYRPFSWTYGETQYGYGLRYQINFSEYEYPYVTPSPSPLPTPTESPHVNINWPSGTPSPTPPFSVPGDLGPGLGSSSQGSLSPGQVDSTLNTFKQYTENNGAFAFLYACTSVIPDEALYFLFILLFVLLLIAVIRLFVHYGG